MIDIQTYRKRIGGFSSNRHRKERRIKTTATSKNRKTGELVIIFAIILSLSIYLPDDGRSSKNRQRGTFNNIQFNNNKEKTVFNKLRTLNTKYNRCVSHLQFFEKCHEESTYPRNLSLHDHFQIAFKTNEVVKTIENINKSTIAKKVHACISHYQLQSKDLKEQILEEQCRLKKLCTEERFEMFRKLLKSFSEKLSKKLFKAKNKKLQKLIQENQYPLPSNKNMWIHNLNLSETEKNLITSNQELDDSIITACIQLIQKQYPQLIIQPPSLFFASGFEYCPFETIQIIHNNAHHWILLSSFNGRIKIYDSLNTLPNESTLSQIKQLFSPDENLPPYELMKCEKQVGSIDCGIFTIAYATDLLQGNEPSTIIYDQSKFRTHLIQCLENGQLTPFPKYKHDKTINKRVELASKSDWKLPRRSKRLQEKTITKLATSHPVTLQNRYQLLSNENENPIPVQPTEDLMNNINENIDENIPAISKNSSPNSIIYNISTISLTSTEKSLLEKGLNFCPTTPKFNKVKLLDDIYWFCRKIRLSEYFWNENTEQTQDKTKDFYLQQERSDISNNFSNKFYQPPIDHNEILNHYLTSVKSAITDLCKKPFTYIPNISNEESNALKNLQSRDDIIIHSADKGGKIVVMNKADYIKECEAQLNNEQFYKPIEKDILDEKSNLIINQVSYLQDQKFLTEKEYKFLTKHFNNPRLPIFYGLPKIHKVFNSFPPLRPIISNYNSISTNLSIYVDSFLKFQAQQCNSYIRDTSDFLQKLSNVKGIHNNSILVTMDVSSLYTNIDHNEGADACFQKLETRTNKHIPSIVIKRLILSILESNVFQFGLKFLIQIMGTAMGTPMACNYANIFMDNFETKLLNDYFKKSGKRPLIWFRFIDDIFFIWNDDQQSLNDFLNFCQNYSDLKKMKSKIKFEVCQSIERVNFLDVTVSIKEGTLATTVFSKPTDAHIYLNATSCHPEHMIKNIPKSQFLRLRKLCSDTTDYLSKSNKYIQFFVSRGYDYSYLKSLSKDMLSLSQKELLTRQPTKKHSDSKSILVTTWHPALKSLKSILDRSYTIIENDSYLRKIFPQKPIIAYRKMKSIKNYIVRTDINKKETSTALPTLPCNKCKICKIINTDQHIKNEYNGTSFKITSGGNCRTKNIIYVARCKIHKLLYVGHTGEELRERFNKHRYDAHKRPENNELATHIYDHKHDFEKDIDVTILKTDIFDKRERELLEDFYICLLGTKSPTGLNKDLHQYASEMYNHFNSLI